MLQKVISNSPPVRCDCSKQGAKAGLGRGAGTGEGKGHAKARWRERYGENRGQFSGKREGQTETRLSWVSRKPRALPRRFCQTHSIMIAKTLSYVRSTERIIYSYLSSGNNLQALVGTRDGVLGTQVLLMILKRKKM